MQTLSDIAAVRSQIKQYKSEGKTIGFVPTMGHLHDGHLTLVRQAREYADVVVVSIFVNPMQFDKSDDLNQYPQTLDADLTKLSHENVALVFTPFQESIYPQGTEAHTFVEVPALSNVVEGFSRPGHFRGVATVITKLFNLIEPDYACFGEKDFQQLMVIKRLTHDLGFYTQIISVPTVREMDGLAMSSRNALLTLDERQRAPVLARTMRWISSSMRGGRHDIESILEDANDQLRAAGLQPDEIFIRDAHNLEPIHAQSAQAVILMSAFLGKVRLIDNLVVDLVPETPSTDSVDKINTASNPEQNPLENSKENSSSSSETTD